MTRQLTFASKYSTYDFRPPQWQPRDQVNTRTGALLFVTILWLMSCAVLGATIWHSLPTYGMISASLALGLVVIGLAIIVGWRYVLRQWRRRVHRGPWPALNRRQLQRLSPVEFEQYVADRLFARHGYKVENTQESRDGGVDIIVEDSSGRRAIVQCKRYSGTVGAPTVRDLYGTVIHNGVDMGYLVTTGKISNMAREWAAGKPLILVDGDRLIRFSRAEPEYSTTR